MNKSLLKKNQILNLLGNSLIYLPSPVNISLWWNFGSLLGLCLMIQIISGLFLSMHYISNINYSFLSIIHIIQDVNYGWLMRLIHLNGASLFFICIYLHIGRGMYYGSFKLKNTWIMGVLILLLLMTIAFLGYVLPWGQMSFWGATVITNLFSTIPYIGYMLVEWLWGGFSVNNATLNRFYTFHFLTPFMLILFVLFHLIFLHESGSNNPLGVNSDFYKIIFHNYYTFKDMLSFTYILFMFFFLIFEYPYILGDPENFIIANPMVTPIHIQPEWYFLFAYTILRSIPNKLGGAIGLVTSIMILIIMPFLYKTKFQSLMFYPLNQIYFWMFFYSFILLTWLGSQPIEFPFLKISQYLTIFYFLFYFLNFYLMKLWDNFIK
uniref:Cytochrome b n=1 Tax=Virgulibracon endoxylaphagus TaxID=2933211 RepID=A0A8T9JCY3_9HYME|nr:cytochrome b [Virgulibracon endoxylaphagus]UOK09635.1 cytochrome b [Virgulibracon endoxylaphagus]